MSSRMRMPSLLLGPCLLLDPSPAPNSSEIMSIMLTTSTIVKVSLDVELENASRKLCLTSHTIFCFAFTGRRSTGSFCERSLLIGMMESHPTSRNQESCVVHHFLLLDFLGWHPSNASDVCSSVPVNKSRKLSGNNCKNKSDV